MGLSLQLYTPDTLNGWASTNRWSIFRSQAGGNHLHCGVKAKKTHAMTLRKLLYPVLIIPGSPTWLVWIQRIGLIGSSASQERQSSMGSDETCIRNLWKSERDGTNWSGIKKDTIAFLSPQCARSKCKRCIKAGALHNDGIVARWSLSLIDSSEDLASKGI